ncbi:hypothetical protein Q4525_18960 [Shimia thalassica]|uniref:hypothetical protein n=1 Tax=Shimia thalassica TaxID=1715693 RepID=UPI001C0A57F2|nr:hypothetical protein [Shimia thalassica]MBU2942692.1 hypothetical protein [Shimia thalassica]MDO6485816.1 hypothetical protein [Shimia thalassica]MDO6505023.1 hypothetical protein [Shimia thalassica]
MGAAKPILGYPSRTAAVVAMHRDGKSHREIAMAINDALPKDEMKIGVERVESLLNSGARAIKRGGLGHDVAARGAFRAQRIKEETVSGFAPAAAKRGIAVEVLLNRLLGVLLRDDLIDAILDDGVGHE